MSIGPEEDLQELRLSEAAKKNRWFLPLIKLIEASQGSDGNSQVWARARLVERILSVPTGRPQRSSIQYY